AFAAADGLRPGAARAARISPEGLPQPLGRDEPIDQADRQRLVNRNAPRTVEHVLAPRRPDEIDQAARLDETIEQAELGGRDREIGVFGAEAQIAAQADR